jgi:DNA adenine methylase
MADGASFPPLSTAPPLKWAGGKRWFTQRHADWLLSGRLRLVEPFVGSAAVFFHLCPREAKLSDSNPDLINFYRVLKESHIALEVRFRELSDQHSKDFYYHVRESDRSDDLDSAAKFLYLNRTCWNGLYRVNRRGKFNVPKGSKEKATLPNDDFAAWSARLQKASLECADFEATINAAEAGDFVFADPPYSSHSQPATFAKYNRDLFTWADQERLATSLVRAHHRGVKFMLTNADTPELRALYDDLGTIRPILCASVISGANKGRGVRGEIAWANYDLPVPAK